MAKIRRMFPGGNTSQGFVSLHDNIINDRRNKLYILKGMPGGGKSSLMTEIGERALDKGYSLEYHHCPSDPESIDGLVINELAIAIVDGTPPHSIDPVYPGLSDRIINLAAYINEEEIAEYKKEIEEAKEKNSKAYRRAFNYLKAARSVYKEIENINREAQDFKKINQISREYLDEIFSHEIVDQGSYSFKNREIFSSAYTPKGYFDYTDTIVAGLAKKYYLKGELGTGKSKFLNRLMKRAKMENFHLEIYYNAFAPEKIESILIYELDLIVSANEAIRLGDYKTIDFNRFFDKARLDTGKDYLLFNKLMEEGIRALNLAERNHFKQEELYNSAIDFTGVDREREMIWQEIEEFIRKKA